MKVYLAGYNVDTSVLSDMQAHTIWRQDVTPEVISAAYARISRDPRPVNELRDDSRQEVERSRRSNSTIIFKMGHHSVAEHAVFNLDILGVSRLAMEELEKFRLCSYTEKSQRYITLDKDFIIPREIKDTGLENMFVDMIGRQNAVYSELYDKLKVYVFEKNKVLADNPKNHNLLEGWAKEDARYITAQATESQVGMTINARNLELLLRRFASHPLAEVQDLGRAIYAQICDVAPSIVIFHEANERDRDTYPELKKAAAKILGKKSLIFAETVKDVELVEYSKNGDDSVAAALLHTSCGLPYKKCLLLVRKMSKQKKQSLFQAAWRNMQFYDSMLREFEYASLSFNVVLSAACFGQLKRHRMATIIAQGYDPRLGLTVPAAVKEIGQEKSFREIADKSAKVYAAINKKSPLAASYILTNAHRRRVLIRLNARELYHVSRLREDAHAQWDIQNISRAMTEKAKKVMPLVFGLIGGKDRYNEIYRSVFGKLPKVVEAKLPGERKIDARDNAPAK